MLTRNQIIIIAAIGFVALFFVLIFLGIIPGLNLKKQGGSGSGERQLLQLSFWGVEDENAFKPILNSYEGNGVKVNYTQFDENNYEKILIDALASGKGPDILAFHNTWLPKHSGKIVPASAAVFSVIGLKNLFPQVVEKDFSANGNVYALPLYIDTLAFIYNRDYFDSHGIPVIPKSWTDFQGFIPALRENDALGRINKTAAAIGGSEKSINKASDLLSLIMLQFGVEMNAENSYEVDFYRDEKSAQALNFYLQFSDSGSQFYSWNDNLRYSLDNFSSGGLGAIFNYASAIPLIKEKNPFLNLGIAPMLQFSKESVNYADYWGMAVSNQSKQQTAAWNFIVYAAANPAVSEQYLQVSKKPPALRVLIQKYFNDPDLGVFASQALTAKSWKQKDNVGVRKIFSRMIESVLNEGINIDRALQRAENEINGL